MNQLDERPQRGRGARVRAIVIAESTSKPLETMRVVVRQGSEARSVTLVVHARVEEARAE